jgi:hypothetical protein
MGIDGGGKKKKKSKEKKGKKRPIKNNILRAKRERGFSGGCGNCSVDLQFRRSLSPF